MIGRLSVAAISMCIAACASSGPETPAPAETASSASVDAVASDNPSAPPAGLVPETDPPAVEQTAIVSPASDADEIICKLERESGSNMRFRVCRKRSEIEARSAADQDALRNSRGTEAEARN